MSQTYPHQPKCDAALGLQSEYNDDFPCIVSPARIEEFKAANYEALAQALGIERQQVQAALLVAGLSLCKVRA
jgi:hypothetical protein